MESGIWFITALKKIKSHEAKQRQDFQHYILSSQRSSTTKVELLSFAQLIADSNAIIALHPQVGKTHGTISAVQMDFVQIAFQPHPPQATGPLGATFFAEN